MVAVNVDWLPQVGGYNGFADIEHGIPHLLDAMGNEQPGHQLFRAFLPLQSRSVFFHQFLTRLVQVDLDLANLEGQPGVAATDRGFNPVKPSADPAQHEFTGAGAGARPVAQLIQLPEALAAQSGNMLKVCRYGFNGPQRGRVYT